MPTIEQQINIARQSLLDLTMRNRLLNYRPSKARTIRIVDENAGEVFDILVLGQHPMDFSPGVKKYTNGAELENRHEQSEDISLTREEASSLWSRVMDGDVPERHRDKSLQTVLEPDVLRRRLFYISQQANTVFEEQGYNVLYLAIGFLEWTESDTETNIRKAPLLLIPVELERLKVRGSFKIKWSEEDIQTNISLKEKLAEQGINLPDFTLPDDKSGVDKYFQTVAKAISHKLEWRVVNDLYLDFFSFTKFVMYKDLDEKTWPQEKLPRDHQLIKQILEPSTAEMAHEPIFNEEEVDLKLKAHNLYHVMDADPSQIAVIQDIKSGHNLVVEGPPGTGKSQTITNVIAELLANGKTVLFVSEKMAALEVVKNRLDRCGLGDFCLELHSRKSNKKQLLAELQRTLARPRPNPISLDEKLNQLEDTKRQLNLYVKDLREPFGGASQSPYELFALKDQAYRHFSKTSRSIPRIVIAGPDKITQNERSIALTGLKNLSEALALVKPLKKHPWFGCSPGTVMPSDQEDLHKEIEECRKVLKALCIQIDKVVVSCALKKPVTINELEQAIIAARIISGSVPIAREVLLNAEWNDSNQEADALVRSLEEYQKSMASVLNNFDARVLEENISSICEEYKTLAAKLFKLFFRRYRELRKQILGFYKNGTKKDDKLLIADLEDLAKVIKMRGDIRQSEKRGQAFFGAYWKAENSDSKFLQTFSSWVVSFRKQLIQRAFADDALNLVEKGLSQKDVIKDIESLCELQENFIYLKNKLADQLGINNESVFGSVDGEVRLSEYDTRFGIWINEIGKLQRWSQFSSLSIECINSVAKPVISALYSDELEPNDLMPAFNAGYADSLLRLVFKQKPSLANFEGSFHENKIKRFVELDNEIISKNRQRLGTMLYDRRPPISGGASHASEAGILLGEFNRQRGLMPIRKLMFNAGNLIQKIKPCFMMSPLSIAQFLDPRLITFDVIIFDEASQVRPEDSLGAILRGRQLVVMGDSKQLPPTSFFDHYTELTDEENSDQIVAVTEVESILHQCKRSFRTKVLRWHYRSKHESLIAVSNQEFYDNNLLVYPSAFHKLDNIGLKFIHVKEGVYDRGRSSVNIVEAKTVAEAAFKHYRDYPNKSLGVGTFNIKQQQAILEQIELLIQQNPDMEEYFKSDREEHFFVKNLETIQGDERDVIFLSIGFGFDENRNLSLNFGPLNQDGGHRRLNVLISRSRENCIVYSNFQAKDLKVEPASPFGLRALKTFLDYAENRNLQSLKVERQDFDSPFEESVYDVLTDNGYEVHKQVGCAKFRVDLGILDTKNPGRYLVAIECDGAKYHSAPVARDRDRLRQQILEGQGWRIYRIWSTDWYRNRKETEVRLLEAVKKLKNTPYQDPALRINEDAFKKAEELGPQDNRLLKQLIETDELDSAVSDYVECDSLPISTSGELHEASTKSLMQAIEHVVKIEAPVYVDDVVKRIRTLWGLRRSGSRIQDKIEECIAVAKKNGVIRRQGKFLWPTETIVVKPRRRIGEASVDIDGICDEELAEGIKLVLKYQHATAEEELAKQVSRIFGIQATRESCADRIRKCIQQMLNQKQLQLMANGMILIA